MNTVKHLWAATVLILVTILAASFIHGYIVSARNEQAQKDAVPFHAEIAKEQKDVVTADQVNQKILAAKMDMLALQRQAPAPTTQVDYDRIAQMIEARTGAKVEAKASTLDAPSSIVARGNDSAKKITDYMTDCDQKDIAISSCKSTSDKFEKLYNTEVTDHNKTKDDLKQANKDLKGGGLWRQMGRGATHSICGGLATGAGLGTAKKSGEKAGAIVGAGAWLGCEFFAHIRK